MIDTCKANLIQHLPAVAENSRVPWGRETMATVRSYQPIRSFQFISGKNRIAPPKEKLEDGVYFRLECEARQPQRASTPLKSTAHLAGSPSGQINKTHYFSTQRGWGYKHVPTIKSLACDATAVYETVYLQTFEICERVFLGLTVEPRR